MNSQTPESESNTKQGNPDTKACAAHVPFPVDLNELFADRFRASLLNHTNQTTIDFVLESKAIEYMSGLKLLSNPPQAHSNKSSECNDIVARHLIYIISALTFNLDMEKVKASIRPCGDPSCTCEQTKNTIVGGLIMLRDYLHELDRRDKASSGSVGA